MVGCIDGRTDNARRSVRKRPSNRLGSSTTTRTAACTNGLTCVGTPSGSEAVVVVVTIARARSRSVMTRNAATRPTCQRHDGGKWWSRTNMRKTSSLHHSLLMRHRHTQTDASRQRTRTRSRRRAAVAPSASSCVFRAALAYSRAREICAGTARWRRVESAGPHREAAMASSYDRLPTSGPPANYGAVGERRRSVRTSVRLRCLIRHRRCGDYF